MFVCKLIFYIFVKQTKFTCMFRTFLDCVVLLLFNLNANAQSSFVKPLIFGAKLSLNGSVFTADVDFFDLSSSMNDQSFSSFLRLAAYGGVTVDYMITDRFSVGAEVLYSIRSCTRGCWYLYRPSGQLYNAPCFYRK